MQSRENWITTLFKYWNEIFENELIIGTEILGEQVGNNGGLLDYGQETVWKNFFFS